MLQITIGRRSGNFLDCRNLFQILFTNNPYLRVAEEKMEKRKFKKRAKRKKIAEQEKTLKKKSTKVSAAGGGGASLPAHVTNA